MRKSHRTRVFVALAAGLLIAVAAVGKPAAQFEQNLGQTDAKVAFIARADGYTGYVFPDRLLLTMKQGKSVSRFEDRWQHDPQMHRFGIRFTGANATATVTGVRPGKAHSNYLRQGQAAIRAPHFEQVKVTALYPGVDLIYQADRGRLRYDLVLSPGADTKQIKISFAGIEAIDLAADGELHIRTAGGMLRQAAPLVYQEIDGKKQPVDGSFVLLDQTTVGFKLAGYDPDRAVVIDPTLDYSSYFGGTAGDSGRDIGLDAAGNIIIAGTTASVDFPVANALDAAFNGSGVPLTVFTGDVFVSKFTPDGQALLFSTYIGGSDSEGPQRMRVDGNGDIVVAGRTGSSDFPVTAGAFQTVFKGSDPLRFGGAFAEDGFLFKLSNDGSTLIFSTYIGGTDLTHPFDELRGIEFDAADNIYVIGNTGSPDYPATGVIGSAATCVDPTSIREAAVTVGKFAPDGSNIFLQCFGGSGRDSGRSVGLDSSGNLYVAGWTESTDFPTTAGVVQPASGGIGVFPLRLDGWVAKLNGSASSILWATYLGGPDPEFLESLVVDASDNVAVSGQSASAGYPVFNAFQGTFGGIVDPTQTGGDGVITKLTPDGTAFVFSSFIGGSGNDFTWAETIDAQGRIYLGGFSNSADFPTVNPIQASNAGANDIIVAAVTAAGTLEYSTYLGGSDGDSASNGLVSPATGIVYLAGSSSSADYPLVLPFQAANAGDSDAVISRLEIDLDDDMDGVFNADDLCPDTMIPESVPTRRLGKNRYALVDGDTVFDTVRGKAVFTTADTFGCSCEQIIEIEELGKGQRKFGCSRGAIEDFIEDVLDPDDDDGDGDDDDGDGDDDD